MVAAPSFGDATETEITVTWDANPDETYRCARARAAGARRHLHRSTSLSGVSHTSLAAPRRPPRPPPPTPRTFTRALLPARPRRPHRHRALATAPPRVRVKEITEEWEAARVIAVPKGGPGSATAVDLNPTSTYQFKLAVVAEGEGGAVVGEESEEATFDTQVASCTPDSKKSKCAIM